MLWKNDLILGGSTLHKREIWQSATLLILPISPSLTLKLKKLSLENKSSQDILTSVHKRHFVTLLRLSRTRLQDLHLLGQAILVFATQGSHSLSVDASAFRRNQPIFS